MSKMRHGFTLVEVALFLAVTGLLFAGVMIGVQNSIWQQRYNDTVQNFTNFLRNIYSEVSNPQSPGDGRSDRAIYGKLVSFGQRYGLDGDKLSDSDQKIYVYDVVGDIDTSKISTGSVAEMLKKLNANVVIEEKNESGVTVGATLAGIVESYSPVWGSVIETTSDKENALFEGSILVVRHPEFGTINTLVSEEVIDVNNIIKLADYGTFDYGEVDELLTSKLDTSFKLEEVNFCVNPYGMGESGTAKRNIRIIKNARNSSGVEIIELDSENNPCL